MANLECDLFTIIQKLDQRGKCGKLKIHIIKGWLYNKDLIFLQRHHIHNSFVHNPSTTIMADSNYLLTHFPALCNTTSKTIYNSSKPYRNPQMHLVQQQPLLREIFKEPQVISYRKGCSPKRTHVSKVIRKVRKTRHTMSIWVRVMYNFS